tara:strand:+ start:4342 stop:4656 length:315 start_codon:yes stop_codon:yes gene_type:complete
LFEHIWIGGSNPAVQQLSDGRPETSRDTKWAERLAGLRLERNDDSKDKGKAVHAALEILLPLPRLHRRPVRCDPEDRYYDLHGLSTSLANYVRLRGLHARKSDI